MKLPRFESTLHPLIFLAPGVSIFLCFLFFFLFSNNFLFQPGITLKLPQVPFLAILHHDPLIIAITGTPQPEIYFENEVLSLSQLKEKFHSYHSPQQCIIKADISTPYEFIMMTAATAIEAGFSVILAADH